MRQIDTGIVNRETGDLHLIIEAKRYSRKVSVDTAGAFVSLRNDVAQVPGLMVTTLGFSNAAKNLLRENEIDCLVVTVCRAQSLRWLERIRKLFPLDRTFAVICGEFFEAMRKGYTLPWLDESEIGYEEWLAVTRACMEQYPRQAVKVLRHVARLHTDPGHRWNAVQILNEYEMLDRRFAEVLKKHERDPELAELLSEIIQS